MHGRRLSTGQGGGGVRIQSPTPYCVLGDFKNFDHHMASQLSFEDPSTPGYFYNYARSPIAHTAKLGGIYTFSTADILPAQTFGAGWSA